VYAPGTRLNVFVWGQQELWRVAAQSPPPHTLFSLQNLTNLEVKRPKNRGHHYTPAAAHKNGEKNQFKL